MFYYKFCSSERCPCF